MQIDDGIKNSCQKWMDIECSAKIDVRQFLDDKHNGKLVATVTIDLRHGAY